MIKILGHRGYISSQQKQDYGYQNSLSAFRNALEFGDGFETDACLSSDGEIFLVHEAKYITPPVEYVLAEHLDAGSIEIVNNRRLDELSSEEIKSLRLHSGEHIPTLEEAITIAAAYRNKIINIELKGYQTARVVRDKIERAIAYTHLDADNFLVSSFNHEAVFDFKMAVSTNIQTGLIFAMHEQARTPLFPWTGDDRCYEPFSRDILEEYKAKKYIFDVIIIPEPDLNKDNLEMIKDIFPAAKIGSWVFTELNKDIEEFYKKIEILAPEKLIDYLIVDNTKDVRERLKTILNA